MTISSEGKKLLDKEIANRRQMIARGQTPKGGKDFHLRLIGLRLSNLRDEKATKGKGKLDKVSAVTWAAAFRKPSLSSLKPS